MNATKIKWLLVAIIVCSTVSCITQPTFTPTPSIKTDAEFTATSHPVLEPTSTVTKPVPKPIPILEANVAQAEIQRLLSTDDICSFPCWWGIYPGKTKIDDVQSYLNSFSSLMLGEPRFSEEGGYSRLIIPQQAESSFLDITFQIESKSDIVSLLQVSIQMSHTESNASGQSWLETSWNDPALTEIINQYNLYNILSKYGEPSSVLLFTHQTALINRPLPMSIVLLYPQHGFMIEYVTDGQITSDNIIGCPLLSFPYFWFWDSSQQVTIRDIVSLIAGYQTDNETIDSFKSFQDVTGEFYSSFTVDKNRCIETAKTLWKLPE